MDSVLYVSADVQAMVYLHDGAATRNAPVSMYKHIIRRGKQAQFSLFSKLIT
jgi:hypothetical protein